MEVPSPLYVTAPAIPISLGMISTAQFYSAPASPTRSWTANAFNESNSCSNFEDFEFETSRKFGGDTKDGERPGGRRERGGSLPAMAFADELFDNGRVLPLPLKPPPRFQIDGDMKSSSERLTDWSPKLPAPMFRVPFSRRNVWNDDYDPFIAALQKVKEENRGTKNSYGNGDDHHHHRRTRSHLPLRTINGDESQFGTINGDESPFRRINGDEEGDQIQGFNKEIIGPMSVEPKLKGSMYARWVLLYQTQNMGPSPKKKGPNKPNSNTGKNGGNAISEDTKMQKIKGIIVKYTSFGKDNGNGEGKKVKNPISGISWKSSYFKKFHFKYKGNRSENENHNQNGNGESRIVLVKLQPAMCLGYGVQSPRNMQGNELSS